MSKGSKHPGKRADFASGARVMTFTGPLGTQQERDNIPIMKSGAVANRGQRTLYHMDSFTMQRTGVKVGFGGKPPHAKAAIPRRLRRR